MQLGKLVQWLFGIDGDGIPTDADVRIGWTNLPSSWRVFFALFIGVALVYAALWIYRRDAARLTARQRKTLVGLRLAAVVLLLLTALGPAIAFTHYRILRPTVVVLRDSSLSMTTADRFADTKDVATIAAATGRTAAGISSKPPTRAEIVNDVFAAREFELLKQIDKRGQLRILDFAESVTALSSRSDSASSTDFHEDSSGKKSEAAQSQSATRSTDANRESLVWPPLKPTGPGTNLQRALTEALAERLTAAVVVVSDGQHTDRATSRDDVIAVAKQAKLKDAPLLIVGLGDPTRPRNVQASEVYADAQVWKDDPFELQATVRSEGLGASDPVKVSLLEFAYGDDDKVGEPTTLETRDVPLPADGGQVRLTFSQTPKQAGRFGYSIRIEPISGESTVDDNQSIAPTQVKVIDDKARVLLVAGKPSWDYRFVRLVLEREKSIDLSCWLQTLDEDRAQEGDNVIRRLPRTKEELFEYDVVMLLDPNPREFDEAWIKLLTEFVGEHSGGLLYMAGPTFTTQFLASASTGEIKSLLPVRLGDIVATDVAALLDSGDREWPISTVDANADHPVMRFHQEAQRSLELWKLMPGILWSLPIRDAAPAATVLLAHADPSQMQASGPRPLMLAGQFGMGRTVFVGFEGTWRWRQVGRNAEYFNRFWVQTSRYLIEGRALEGKRRGTIETDRTRYEVGDRITVVGRLMDAVFKPLEQPEVGATLQVEGQAAQPIVLRPIANQPGRYEAALTAQHTGRHALRVNFGDDTAASAPKVEATFSVSPPSVESERTWQDKPLLEELAAASGGRYFELSALSELPAAIPNRQQTISIQGKPIPLWDTSRLLIVIVGVLVTEWALRKRWKLM